MGTARLVVSLPMRSRKWLAGDAWGTVATHPGALAVHPGALLPYTLALLVTSLIQTPGHIMAAFMAMFG